MEFSKHEWILITNDLLPGSQAKNYKTQIEMIADLKNKAFLSYEIPNYKYALAANLLEIAAKNGCEGLWLQPHETEGRTRVRETFRYVLYDANRDFEVREGVLSVGSLRENANLSVAPIVNNDDREELSSTGGIAAMYRFQRPEHSFCNLS